MKSDMSSSLLLLLVALSAFAGSTVTVAPTTFTNATNIGLPTRSVTLYSSTTLRTVTALGKTNSGATPTASSAASTVHAMMKSGSITTTTPSTRATTTAPAAPTIPAPTTTVAVDLHALDCKGSWYCGRGSVWRGLDRIVDFVSASLGPNFTDPDPWITRNSHIVCDTFRGDFDIRGATCAFMQHDAPTVRLSTILRGLNALRQGNCSQCGSVQLKEVGRLMREEGSKVEVLGADGKLTELGDDDVGGMEGLLTVNFVSKPGQCGGMCIDDGERWGKGVTR